MPGLKPYFGLFVFEDSSWSYEFGDFDKQCVESEREDWLDHYDSNDVKRRRKNTLVLRLKNCEDWRVRMILDALNEDGVMDVKSASVRISVINFTFGS